MFPVLRFRIRSSFSLFLVIIGFVLCSFICATSAANQKKISFVLTRPFVLGNRDYNDGHYSETSRVSRRSRSPPPPPTSDDDFVEEGQMEHRRGAFDPHGRSVIFKSLILAPLALVVLILFLVLLVPIPVISSPLGRSLQSSTSPISFSSSMYTLKMARDVLTSEECVERVSCELSKISRSYDSTSWIPLTLEKLLAKSKWSERIIRGLKGTTSSACSQFTCTPAKHLKRTLKNSVTQ